MIEPRQVITQITRPNRAVRAYSQISSEEEKKEKERQEIRREVRATADYGPANHEIQERLRGTRGPGESAISKLRGKGFKPSVEDSTGRDSHLFGNKNGSQR